MIVIGLKTDQPLASIYLLKDGHGVAEHHWEAHRTLARDLLAVLAEFMEQHAYEIKSLNGIIYYHGPGSFTGLRIGGSVVNAASYSMGIPVVATGGAHWIEDGVKRLKRGENDSIVSLEYGGQIHITVQKK